MLSSAVYEAWYFQKLDEARRNKKAEVLNDQRKKEDFEKVETSFILVPKVRRSNDSGRLTVLIEACHAFTSVTIWHDPFFGCHS